MEEITVQQEQAAEFPETFQAEKRRLLFIYVPLFVLASVIVATVLAGRAERVVDVLMSIGLNFCAFAWCRMDSRERRYELHHLFPLAIIFLGLLALLYYLFRSRGFRGGLISTAWLILYVALCFAAVTVVGLIIVIALLLTGVVSPEVFGT